MTKFVLVSIEGLEDEGLKKVTKFYISNIGLPYMLQLINIINSSIIILQISFLWRNRVMCKYIIGIFNIHCLVSFPSHKILHSFPCRIVCISVKLYRNCLNKGKELDKS